MPAPNEIALIFDLDGTLVHSTIDFMGTRHRLIDLLETRGAASGPREDLVRLAIPQLVAIGASFDAALGEAMWEVVAAAEAQGLKDALPDAQARPVLEELKRRGYRLALLTNNARAGVVAKLDEFSLTALFDILATRTEVAVLKPSPAGIRYVLDRLPGVTRAFVIGDAWIDGLAAQQAGIPFIGVGSKRDVALERGVKPWAWISELRELLQLRFDQELES